jgi:ribosomal protein S18 acetylase RimI-like enzyme
MSLSIRRIDQADEALLATLSSVLADCVLGGASVGFMNPLTLGRALDFWRGGARGVAAGEALLFVAETDHGVVGTVQLVLAQPENQPHRGDISKLLVHRAARRCGAGEALMLAAEEAARAAGKTLLVLDTASPDAQQLYLRLGWALCGRIPGYALWPDGGLVDTTLLYKQLM